MSKNKLKFTFDEIFWWLLAGLPLILIIINQLTFESGNTQISLLLNTMGFNTSNVLSGNVNSLTFLQPVSGSLSYILARLLNYMLPTSENYAISQYLAYYIQLQLIHIAVDFILLLPRITKNLIKKLGGDSYD